MTERQESSERLCIVCGQAKTNGLCIIDEFICDTCENEMVRTNVQDAKYPFFIHQLKRLWVEKNA